LLKSSVYVANLQGGIFARMLRRSCKIGDFSNLQDVSITSSFGHLWRKEGKGCNGRLKRLGAKKKKKKKKKKRKEKEKKRKEKKRKN